MWHNPWSTNKKATKRDEGGGGGYNLKKERGKQYSVKQYNIKLIFVRLMLDLK